MCDLQLGAHLRGRREHPGERLLVGADDGVVRVHHVEGHLARVGVDQHLDRVADVVEVGRQAARGGHGAGVGVLGVGVVVRRGVRVLDPVDLTVEQDRIGIRVEAQERRGLRHPGLHPPVEHQPRVAGDLAGDEQVQVVEPDGEHGLLEERGELDPAVARVMGLDVGAVGQLEVDLGLLGVRHHVAAVVQPEVDRRLGDRGQAAVGLRWDPAHRELRVAVAVVGLAGETDHPVAVGVLEGGVDPGRRREVLVVDLPDAHHHRGLHPVHRVAVDRQGVELVVRADVLQLVVGRLGLERVPEPYVGQGVGVGRQLGGRQG